MSAHSGSEDALIPCATYRFDLLVVKEWPAAEVAQFLGVSLANVYVTKHRIAAAVKREVKRLERTAGGVQQLSKSPQPK